MDRMQEFRGLHDISGEGDGVYFEPSKTVLREAFFGPVSSPPVGPSVSIVALVMANRQVGCGHVS